MARLTRIDGGCHCGNIRYILHWPVDTTEIPVRECGCSFCQKHGGAWTSSTDATLDVAVSNKSLVTEYRFGTATAEFLVCSRCGIVPLVSSDIAGDLYAVVNTNTFDSPRNLSFSRSASDFEGEDIGDRLARRKRNWISGVVITESGA